MGVLIENQTLEELTARLLVEEERMKSLEGAIALASTNSRRNSKHNKDDEDFKKIKCYICQKLGHIAKQCKKNEDSRTNIKKCIYCKKADYASENCWFRKSKEKEKNKETKKDKEPENKSEVNTFVGVSKSFNSEDWYMDTGASEHMCSNRKMFKIMHER